MVKKLFLLDGMALVYRAHFALISKPIFTSKGVNTSALYGFTQTLLDILKNRQPTHIAVAFDTDAPTARHAQFPEYKATRQAMPEDLSQALPHVRRMLEAFRIPVLICDGYEADDIIGTLVRRAEKEEFTCYMVTPDKDFGQLISDKVFLYKPSRMGDGVEILGLPEIQKRWGIQTPDQVVDVLALMGDSVDNVPGVPGIGEKTAVKLIGQYHDIENLLAHTGELTGKLQANLLQHAEQARLSKTLVTIECQTPCPVDLESLKLQKPDDEKLKSLFVEFEFNSIGRRLFGEDFKAGRGAGTSSPKNSASNSSSEQLILTSDAAATTVEAPPQHTHKVDLQSLSEVAHEYHLVRSAAERARLVEDLKKAPAFSFDADTTSSDPKQARLLGLSFSFAPHQAYFVPLPPSSSGANGGVRSCPLLEEFRAVLESERIEKVGHDLKFDISVLKWHGVSVRGKLFDTMIAHSLIEPDMRHSLNFLSEAYLGYSLQSAGKGAEGSKPDQLDLGQEPTADTAEAADVFWQLRSALEPLLAERGQQRVFYDIEAPLIPVLGDMEVEGINVDAVALVEFGAQLSKELDQLEKTICHLAGTTFNVNSGRQLGQILFEVLKISDKPKKTPSGQYATDEQTLTALAPDHEIVQRLLEYRAASKLKSTYADALPAAIFGPTGRIHTTFNQVMTATGRLNSQDPNLQNIPIRRERGQEIRKAFVPRNREFLLLSADYSQIELRIIAALGHEAALLEAFRAGMDIHTATAARVYDVLPGLVTSEMRRKAKMVNYGIAYGISAFGLAQRLGIPRKEGAEIIDQYFRQFPGVRKYMDDTIAFARTNGYVETVTGRRRYIRDIRSSNNTLRGAAERNAINAPIQGSAADMIKIAMVNIHRELLARGLKTRMLLQVHDELVFDLYKPEQAEVRSLVEDRMTKAIPLDVPIVVEMGVGEDWLEAH